jgi:hypothetical protein
MDFRTTLALCAGLLAFPGPVRAAPHDPPDCTDAPEPKGNVVYVCDCGEGAQSGCARGNDAWPGTRARPKRTFEAAVQRFNSQPAGATVALCRGGAFTTQGTGPWNNPRASAANPVTIREYKAPFGGSDLPIVAFTGGTHAVHFGGKGAGYRVWNLDLRAGAPLNTGFFFWGDTDDVDLCGLRLTGFANGVHIAGGGDNERVTLRASRVTGSVANGWLGGSKGGVIDGNVFAENGWPDPLRHQVYLAGSNLVMRVTNNQFLTERVACNGARLVAHGGVDGLLVENNLFRSVGPGIGQGCYGLDLVDGGYPAGRIWYRNLVVRRNRFVANALAMRISQSIDAVVEDNLAVGGSGIRIASERAEGYVTNVRTVIRNNTIHLSRGQDEAIGIEVFAQGDGYVVANNAVFSEAARTRCIHVLAPAAFTGNNYCRTPGGDALAAVFVDTAAGDYTPAARSPLSRAGVASHASPFTIGVVAWSPSDAGRPRSAPPDVGAFQR